MELFQDALIFLYRGLTVLNLTVLAALPAEIRIFAFFVKISIIKSISRYLSPAMLLEEHPSLPHQPQRRVKKVENSLSLPLSDIY